MLKTEKSARNIKILCAFDYAVKFKAEPFAFSGRRASALDYTRVTLPERRQDVQT